ncbi:AAA family ATPase [Thiohalocapsa marina]|uniref:bifunctional aminoglycoside phosphotransferase/ATP-binding protein n=1 Tax=Thiohalocapsa marina TaxID=424902 RepID=UPI0036DDCD47
MNNASASAATDPAASGAAGRFDRLIQGLLHPGAYPHAVGEIERIETHISVVLLAGDYAYKLKKPVDLGFLDFSTLERRRDFCHEELRLNQRLAPDYYLAVVPVTGTVDAPRLGGVGPMSGPAADSASGPASGQEQGPVLEYAVQMRRFPSSALLTCQALDGPLVDALAARIAAFHAAVPCAPPDTPYGTPEAVIAPMRANFAHSRAVVQAGQMRGALERLARWTELRFQQLRPQIEQRRRDGFVRECHGDLHRGNIARVDGDLVIFDCIEFSPMLRWIDTISELAFLGMDLRERGETALARRLLNRYLELTGDYGGLALLRFYQVYRAMVRAKVIGIRLSQGHLQPMQRQTARDELHKYLVLARRLSLRERPWICITTGVSGCGKSWLAARLCERLPLIHIRSDVERKRLFGLSPEARTSPGPDTARTGIDAGIYGADASRRTYQRLAALARQIITAGFPVLVDATFLKAAQRGAFRALAAELGCDFRILALEAPDALLRRRVAERLAAAKDASEADLRVLDHQLKTREPLTEAERRQAVTIDTSGEPDVDALVEALRNPQASVKRP